MAGKLAWQCLALATALASVSYAQQYQGTTSANTLPDVSGASIEFFRIQDQENQNATLINYFSLPPGHDVTLVKRAVIVNTAFDGLPDYHFAAARDARNRATTINSAVQRETAAIFVPLWVDVRNDVQGNALRWRNGSYYASGFDNILPTTRTVSSFQVLDQVITWFNATYPNLNEIVVAGHSLGGQATQRYASVGQVLDIKAKLVYWTADPSSYVWYTPARPASAPTAPAACPAFDDWRFGLANYPLAYEGAFVNTSRAAGDVLADNGVLARFQARNFVFTHGLNDTGQDSEGCGPFTTGDTRITRMLNFIQAFPPGPEDDVDYVPNVTHDTYAIMNSDAGVQRLFIDNINGDGARAADFGPRQQAGDNPHPTADLPAASSSAAPTSTAASATGPSAATASASPTDSGGARAVHPASAAWALVGALGFVAGCALGL